MSRTDSGHLRRMIAGACMVTAPVLLLVATILVPALDTDEQALVAQISAHADAWYAATMFDFAAIVLFVPVALGVMHLLAERAPMAAHVGTGLVVVGLMAAAAAVGANLVYWQMADGNAAQMAALMDRVNGSAGSSIPLMILTLCIPLGTCITAWALYSTRIAHWSTALSIAVGTVVLFAGSLATDTTVLIIGAAVLLVGFASLGRMVLTETDEEWEHPADFRGFGFASR